MPPFFSPLLSSRRPHLIGSPSYHLASGSPEIERRHAPLLLPRNPRAALAPASGRPSIGGSQELVRPHPLQTVLLLPRRFRSTAVTMQPGPHLLPTSQTSTDLAPFLVEIPCSFHAASQSGHFSFLAAFRCLFFQELAFVCNEFSSLVLLS
jgi:hypothetical protein